MRTLIALLCLTAFSIESNALQKPRSGVKDGRVKTFVYHADEVYTITGFYLHQTFIEFAPYEEVLHIPIGDSTAWQVIKVGHNAITAKPIAENAYTNATVVTSKRVYNFELYGGQFAKNPRSRRITYKVRFRYPEDERIAAERENRKQAAIIRPALSPDDLNMNYSSSGDTSIKLISAFDDGDMTYFTFAEHQTIPAIFQVNVDRTESLINWRREGKYIVVERLGRQFSLRIGDEILCVFNEQYEQQVKGGGVMRQRANR